jgi:hypothetical protein
MLGMRRQVVYWQQIFHYVWLFNEKEIAQIKVLDDNGYQNTANPYQ